MSHICENLLPSQKFNLSTIVCKNVYTLHAAADPERRREKKGGKHGGEKKKLYSGKSNDSSKRTRERERTKRQNDL